MAEAYIVEAVRTAGGKRGGRLAGWHPAELAGQVLNGLLDRSGVDPELIEDVIMGCVTQIGEQALDVGRGAVLSSRLPESVPATSVDRQCGSSQQAVHFAAQAVMSGSMDIVIAAGVESMTRVPMLSNVALAEQAGFGTPFGPVIKARYPGKEFSQFIGAEMMAEKFGLAKRELDEYALESQRRAAAATRAGAFASEILPVPVAQPDGSSIDHVVDEGIRFETTLEAIAGVRLLREGGVITAANASQICDGAAGLLIVNERGLMTIGRKPLARIHHMSVLGHDPVIMLEAPIPASQRALKRAGLGIGDIDLAEVNEAFAPVPLAWIRSLEADPARVNALGGAIALGHPLGASGARLMTTLVHALIARGGRYGLQTMCEFGGMANVTIIERLA